jgi:phosphoribosylaminoimidazolecarboxamide formyltransferase / IMP cyclohydrolase
MSDARIPIKRALLSVFDKTGIVDLARLLDEQGCELLSTGGTARLLRSEGLPVKDVSEITDFPEMMDGRVKTLHPRVHGGLLARRDNDEDMRLAKEHSIGMIDLVVVTLYPFEEVSARPDAALSDLVENVDIGGPTMLRSAAKNHAFVSVLCDQRDYSNLADQLSQGGSNLAFRRRMAAKVFARTAAYDGLIAATLGSRFEALELEASDTPDATKAAPYLSSTLERTQVLRYGENPHQAASVYGSLEGVEILHGKALSYNNLIDVDAALDIMRDFPADSEPACAILKHTNPCGLAIATSSVEAFERAFATDTVSPFGGILIWNRPMTLELAKRVHKIFTEILIVPSYDDDALAHLRRKKDRRLLTYEQGGTRHFESQMRHFFGGMLVQDHDSMVDDQPESWRCVTDRQPTDAEWRDLQFAWKAARHVKSNAIVLARDGRTIGIGAGQMSRLDASEIAVMKAKRENHEIEGCALGSDAFFPFADGVEAAAAAGVRAVIQPGGSVRDEEVITAANRLGLCMVFTGRRHFRH